MKYVIGTGYYNRKGAPIEEFRRIWYSNTLKYSAPLAIHTVSSGSSFPPFETLTSGKWLDLSGDLGDIHMLMDGTLSFAFCGWTMSVLTLALMAYQEEADFIFKEQDCLAFGPWVEALYSQINGRSVLFGNCRTMLCAQSLFMVKHSFIPEFVRMMLEFRNEHSFDKTGEHKFAKMELDHPKHFGRFNFGYDRDRPFNVKDRVFYVQQLTSKELKSLYDYGLINEKPETANCVYTTHK